MYVLIVIYTVIITRRASDINLRDLVIIIRRASDIITTIPHTPILAYGKQ
jgi:hypothetical protein